MSESRPYTVISADTHAGADMHTYKEYLPASWHEQFDAWAAEFSDPWARFDEGVGDNLRFGPTSFMSPVNWQSDQRLRDLEDDGVVAEVVFPNTVPPFYPAGCITAPAPTTRDEYERRLAGVRAHNRWLVDFCDEAPGRRAGIAQIFLDDVDDTLAEIAWAAEHGLKGVLIPADHQSRTINVHYPRLEPIWAALEEYGLPIHRHGAIVHDPESDEAGVASPALGFLEAGAFGQRVFQQLVLAGVFDRHPKLQLCFVETIAVWVPDLLQKLDAYVRLAGVDGSLQNLFAGKAAAGLSKLPSEYWRSNCLVGSFLSAGDMAIRDVLGVESIMWGVDYPHHEGVWPNSHKGYRAAFANVPQPEVRRMLGENAARVYGFDLDALAPIAERVGPRPDDVAVPLELADYPAGPCPTFAGQYVAALAK